MSREKEIKEIAKILRQSSNGRCSVAVDPYICMALDLVDNGIRSKDGFELEFGNGYWDTGRIEPVNYEEEE